MATIPQTERNKQGGKMITKMEHQIVET